MEKNDNWRIGYVSGRTDIPNWQFVVYYNAATIKHLCPRGTRVYIQA